MKIKDCDNKKEIDGNNFYENPFPIIFECLDSLMPKYLWIIYFLIVILEILFFHSLNLSNLKFDIFLNSSIAGLSLIPVLFGAITEIYKKEDLIELVTYKEDENGNTSKNVKCNKLIDKFKNEIKKIKKNNNKDEDEDNGYGTLFDGIMAPFVFTSIIFLLVGSSSLFVSAIKINTSISFEVKNVIKLIYLDVLLLGIFILFGTVMCVFQMYYDKVLLDTESFLNKKNQKK